MVRLRPRCLVLSSLRLCLLHHLLHRAQSLPSPQVPFSPILSGSDTLNKGSGWVLVWVLARAESLLACLPGTISGGLRTTPAPGKPSFPSFCRDGGPTRENWYLLHGGFCSSSSSENQYMLHKSNPEPSWCSSVTVRFGSFTELDRYRLTFPPSRTGYRSRVRTRTSWTQTIQAFTIRWRHRVICCSAVKLNKQI